jgi:UDP:flavonoid glycosyltransferase YjiC (YdhE family)
MRVLFSTSGASLGHLNPLLPLARALLSAGHQVALAGQPGFQDRISKAGLAPFSAGRDAEDCWAELARRYPGEPYNLLAPEDILDWYLPRTFGEIAAPWMAPELDEVVEIWKPDLMVHEAFEFAAPVIAAKRGLPSASHGLGPRLTDRQLLLSAAALVPLWRKYGLTPDPDAGLYRRLAFDIIPPSLQPEGLARRQAVVPLRPVGPGRADGAGPAWLEEIGDQPLVLMTLGPAITTNANLDVYRTVIEALAADHVELLITLGENLDPAALGDLPAHVRAERYVPHAEVLPRCALVICHGGAATTLSAMAHGLPVLVLPQGADQYLIAGLCAEAGVGAWLPPPEVTAGEVRGAVRRLLGEASFATAAQRVRDEIVAMPGLDEAVTLLEGLIA